VSEKKDIEDKVVELAEADGWFVRKVSWLGRRRAPDRVFIKGGRVVWIEFKDRGVSKARVDQEGEHAEMIAAGAEVYVSNSIRHACTVLGLPFKPDPLRPHL
jgi:hypothetical protein